jgi:uncharacterized protein YtpQ (UPF0354 family)
MVRSTQSPLSKDDFGRTVADRIKKAGEPGSVTYVSEGFRILIEDEGELVQQFNLSNVYKEYCARQADQRERMLSKIVQTALVRHKTIPEDWEDVQPDVMPAVRSRATFEMLSLEQRSQGKPALTDLPSFGVGDHLLALLVYDMPESTQTIPGKQLQDWGVNFYEAMEVAKENLAAIEMSISKAGDGFYAVMTGDSYDSSRLLLLDLLPQLEIQGDPIAMVPHRDVLLITGADDRDGLAMMAQFAETAFDHPRYLSCLPLALDGTQWVAWMPPAAHPHFLPYRLLELKSLAGLYERQQALLNAVHDQEGTETFVATYSTAESNTGAMLSYSAWTAGVDSLLPKTHKLFLAHPDRGILAGGDWDKVQQAVGDLLEETDLYPVRYRVRGFPSEEQLAAIGNELG